MLLLPRLTPIRTELVAINQRDIMIQRATIASRVLDSEVTQLAPVAAHTDLARPRRNVGLRSLVVQAACVSGQVIGVAGRVLAEHVQAMREVREEPRLGSAVSILADGLAEDVL